MKRPAAARTPSAWKKFPPTFPPNTVCGCSDENLALGFLHPREKNAKLRACYIPCLVGDLRAAEGLFDFIYPDIGSPECVDYLGCLAHFALGFTDQAVL